MANYANQRTVKINIDNIASENNPGQAFLRSITWDSIMNASQKLSGSAFKLWFYLLKWSGTERLFFSPVAAESEFGISNTSARRAFTEMEQAGFILKEEDKVNCYIFVPNP